MLPPSYLLASLLLLAGLRLVAPGPEVPGPWWMHAGLALCAAGVALNVAGDRLFRRANTVMHPRGTPRALVTRGVFRYSRNPMYLGMVLIVAGLAMAAGRTTPFAAPLLLWGILRYRFVAPEERTMAETFGTTYEEYTKRVRRWI